MSNEGHNVPAPSPPPLCLVSLRTAIMKWEEGGSESQCVSKRVVLKSRGVSSEDRQASGHLKKGQTPNWLSGGNDGCCVKRLS